MITKTNFIKDELINFLSAYDLGKLVDVQAFTGGSVQTNLLLKTTKGKYVFRYYRQSRSLDSVLFEVNLIKYLKEKCYPCPAPISNKHGKFTGLYNGRPYVIFEFLEGEHLEHYGDVHKMELVKMIADLHNITKNYRPVNKNHRWNYGVEFCQSLAKKKAEEINTVNSREKLKWLIRELKNLNLPQSLPKGICHCDFHFSNVLFLNGKINALIDFDDANYTYLTFDLVSLAEPFIYSFDHDSWPGYKKFDNVFDFREIRQLVSEYEKYRRLNNNEKRHMFDVYKLCFLIDSIWYFERGDAEDFYEKRKIEYLNNLGANAFYKGLFTQQRFRLGLYAGFGSNMLETRY